MEIKYPNWLPKIFGSPQTSDEMNGIVEVLQNHAETLSLHDVRILAAASGIYTDTLTPSSEVPTDVGDKVFLVTQPGTYTNFGNVILPENNFGFIFKSGNSFSLQSVEMPMQDLSEVEQKIEDVKKSFNLEISSKNKFNKATITPNQYLNTSNGNLTPSEGFWTSDFIQIDSAKKYIGGQGFTFICFYDENKNFISGIGEAGQKLITPTNNSYYIRVSDNNNPDTFQLEEGEVSTSYEDYFFKIIPRYEEKSIVIEKRIVTDGVNFNLIRKMQDSIVDASDTKRYRIIVPKGEWQECDLRGKKNVEIIGEDLFDTVIYNDGLSTRLTPSDYSVSAWANKPLNEVPQHFKHVVYVTDDIDIKNLTIEARGNIKYCAHIDYPKFENVRMKVIFNRTAEEVNNCVGIGIKPNQTIDLSDSVFIRNDNQPAIFVHNSPNQISGSKLILDNTFYQGCSYILVGEMGSGHEDWIYLRNAQANVELNQFITLICELDPTSLPYNFRLKTTGTKINSIVQLPYHDNQNPRPNFGGYIIGKIG
ncbi:MULTISPECIES: hypothetical protein [unclassified Empedobacter]|uniref:hypothetical protein n=1 Tax=unclassified Empedobacter TaxID=2643773 RepID=UPI0025BD29E2|nr:MULTISPECIES: hypothetical protein [unclassified Empedobacter]